MLVISMLVFAGVYAVGNPIDVLLSPDATQQIREQTIKAYGLDQPLWRQYAAFLGRLLAGDFGRSFIFNMPVLELIFSRLPATLELTLIAVLGATMLGVPLGMYAGYRPDGPRAQVGDGGVGSRLFGADLLDRSGPHPDVRGDARLVAGRRAWPHRIAVRRRVELPDGRGLASSGFAGTQSVAVQVRDDGASGARRHARNDAGDTVRFARAAGESEWTILRRHVLRLIAIPIVTVFGLEFGSTLAFAVVTETIFSWPGIGKLIIDSISSLDRPVMVAYLMLVALVFIVINLLVDIAYAVLDPRLRVRRA